MDIVAIVFSAIGLAFSAGAAVTALNLKNLQVHGTGDVRMLPVIFGAVGGLFLTSGILFAVLTIRKRAVRQQVVSNGDYIMADVVNIRQNFSLQVNGKYPYVLECHYRNPETGTLHVFMSRNLFFYPAELENRQVRVYIDRENMRHYYVDVENVFPEVEIH